MDLTRKVLGSREREASAAPRCLGYAACSELVASPHDVDPRPALQARVGLGAALPQAAGLDPLLVEMATADLGALRAAYSGLFEVGDEGPPVPIREDLQPGRAGSREELVRFYDHFGYALGERYAWQPDHLSVLLEFMHFLCWNEAQAETEDEALPYQLAQADFAQRHLASWLAPWAQRVAVQAADSPYARVAAALGAFVAADLAWQSGSMAGTVAQ